jgi:hypothetical protein
MCFGIFLVLSLVGPAIAVMSSSGGLSGAPLNAMLRAAGMVTLGTAAMLVLFLWIGHRAAGAPR